MAGGVGFNFDDPPPEERKMYEAPDAPEGGGVGIQEKIDTSGVEGSIVYEHVWEVLEESVWLGGEEKHYFGEGSED
jgi:hypothetical protein